MTAYVPNPLRCFQQYGHHEGVAETQSAVIAHDVDHCKNPTKCAKYGQGHKANSKECSIWNKESEILRISYTNDFSFVEARKMVEQQTVNIEQSYSSIARSNNQLDS